MTVKRKALGKGFSNLVNPQRGRETTVAAPHPNKGELFACAVDRISPNPHQPRQKFDEEALKALAASIKRDGVLQPLAVRSHPQDEGRYELIAGERRLRAAQRAGLAEVPCVLIETDEEGLGVLSLVENLLREDLNVLDEADAYQQLIDNFDLTQDTIAQRVGRSRVHITNTLRLLKLPEVVRAYLAAGELSPGHGRAILGFNAADDQIAAAQIVRERGLSVRETEELVRRGHKALLPKKPSSGKSSHETLFADWCRGFSERMLGAKTKIVGSKEKGVIAIEYHSYKELMDLTDHLDRSIVRKGSKS